MPPPPRAERHETAYILPGGQSGWAEISYMEMRDPSGNALGRLQVARDITQKKMVERALNISEQHLQAIFDNSVQSFVLLDTQGRIEAFNHLANTWALNYGGRQLRKGQPIQQIWPTGNTSEFKGCLKKVKNSEIASCEDFFITPAGQQVYLELNFLPVLDQANTMTGICFTCLDIRERKNSELTLAQSEARFRSLVQNSSDLIMLLNDEGIISYASESCQRIVGYSSELLHGRRLSDFVHQRDKVRMLDALRSVADENVGAALSLEYRFIKKDGQVIQMESLITNQLADTAIRAMVLNSRDITERKQAEEALRNIVKGVSGYTSEDYFSYLTENLSLYLSIPHVVIAEVRDAVTLETISAVQNSQRAASFRIPSEHGFVADVFANGITVINQGNLGPFAEDYLMRRLGAKAVIGLALRNTKGENIGILVAASDRPFDNISLTESTLRIFTVRAATELERIYATRALLESKANLTALIENTTDSIWSIDREYRLTAQNASFRKHFHQIFTDGLELGDNIMALMREKESRFWEPFFREALQGKRFTREISLPARGSAVNYEISFNPILSGEAEVTGVSIFARDITERKRAELALRQSEANLVALIENTDDVIYSLDAGFRLITSNSSFGHVSQAAGQALNKARDLSAWKTGPFGREWSEYYRRALNGEKFTEEFAIKTGSRHADIETRFNPILTKDKQVTGVSVFARDITERKASETELKKTNFELDSFVYRASHDLRAPLRSVLGLINLIRVETAEASRITYLGLAEKSINKLDTFISDLTHFSRNTRMEITSVEVDFQAIIDECLDNLRYMENADKVESRISIKRKAPFYSDPQRISIIFQNLISNAIKYQRQDVESYVEVSITGDTDGCSIRVADNGKGIKDEYLKRIFEMFFRASEESYGSGLGLYITLQVVEKLQGTIKVNSTFGEGTIFELWLPGIKEDAQPL